MLPLKNRLEKKCFKLLFFGGKKISSVNFNLIYKQNDQEVSKAGFVVSSSVSKYAVERNKIKRRAREIIRRTLNEFKSPYLIIFLFKKEVLKLDFNEFRKEIIRALTEAKLIK